MTGHAILAAAPVSALAKMVHIRGATAAILVAITVLAAAGAAAYAVWRRRRAVRSLSRAGEPPLPDPQRPGREARLPEEPRQWP